MIKKRIRTKIVIGGILTVIYVLITIIASIKFLLHQPGIQSDIYIYLGAGVVFFAIGLAIFSVPTELLLNFHSGGRIFVYKWPPDDEEDLYCASMFYTLFGLIVMSIPMALSVGALLQKLP